jgi:HsdM N-terminal domain
MLRGLCRDLDLEAGEPAESLRSCYGIRPTDGFVRDAWLALRDRWLAKDPLSRSEVVDALWSLGLGEGEPPAHRAEQMSFLRGRNNARRLREVVLDVFIALGETTAVDENPPTAPRVRAGASAPARKRSEAKEPRARVRQPDGHGPTVAARAQVALSDLERRLWDAANALRGPVDPADFKNYVFPMLFWKWVSDNWEWEHSKAIADFGSDVEPEVEADYHHFSLPEGTQWRDVTTKTDNLGTHVARALGRIEQANPDSLAAIFGDAAWGNKERLPESSLVALINALNGLSLSPDVVPHDVLGQAYEYLLKNFGLSCHNCGSGAVCYRQAWCGGCGGCGTDGS